MDGSRREYFAGEAIANFNDLSTAVDTRAVSRCCRGVDERGGSEWQTEIDG